jgi:hypothetical protein
MIYGYPTREVNDYGLLEIRELTFSAPPAVLRDISRFLAETANLMDAGAFQTCSHRHIQSVVTDWNRKFPDKDIVVIPPEEAQE